MAEFIVALTGGIGSGKTAVSDRFKRLGVGVVDADVGSRVVVEPGTPALAAIVEHLGVDILQSDGTLDRPALRKRVFAEPDERRWLESLLHPLVSAWQREQLLAAAPPYAILVTPLLSAGRQARGIARVLVVDVPEALQLERTILRDANSRAQVQAIMAAQVDREARLADADDVIVNDRGFDHLDAEVAHLHSIYFGLASMRRADQQ